VAKSIMRVVRQMRKAVGHACHRWRATSHGHTPLNPRAHTIKTRPLVIERRGDYCSRYTNIGFLLFPNITSST
jgi:hypothetical protein